MNASNTFGSCQLSELDYMLKKQTGLYSESGKELDLFGYFLGICQKITNKCRRQKVCSAKAKNHKRINSKMGGNCKFSTPLAFDNHKKIYTNIRRPNQRQDVEYFVSGRDT